MSALHYCNTINISEPFNQYDAHHIVTDHVYTTSLNVPVTSALVSSSAVPIEIFSASQ